MAGNYNNALWGILPNVPNSYSFAYRAAAAKASEVDDLNAHLDLTEKEREYLAARRRQQTRLKLQSRADSVPDLHHVSEGNFNRFMSDRYGQDLDAEGDAGRVYTGEGYQQRPQHVQAYVYLKFHNITILCSLPICLLPVPSSATSRAG